MEKDFRSLYRSMSASIATSASDSVPQRTKLHNGSQSLDGSASEGTGS